MIRVVAGVVVLVALAVQLFASTLFGALAVPDSLPRVLSASDWPFALANATGLALIPAVGVALSRGALLRGDLAGASAYLAPFAPGASVLDTRGQIALAAGDTTTAMRDFLTVGDYSRARAAIDQLAARDPVAALVVIQDFNRRLSASSEAPEITAEVEWREGQIAATAAIAQPSAAAHYNQLALDAYGAALSRAPNDEKYLLNDAFQALVVGDAAGARTTYTRAAQVVPDSVDAFVGVAVSAAVLGDCRSAQAALERARGFAALQGRRADPAADGYAPRVRAALARCVP